MAAVSEHSETILTLYAAGQSPQSIGVTIGRSRESVRDLLIRRGAYEKGRKASPPCTLPVARIRKLKEQGLGPFAIARTIRRNRHTVYMWMVRNGLHEPYMSPVRSISRAIRRGGLPDELVLALKALPNPPPPTKVISDLSGYGMSTIRSWLNGTRHPTGQAMTDLLATLRKIAQDHARKSH